MSDFEYESGVDIEDVITEPPRYKVVILNDDYSTFDFVIYILKTVFRKNDAEAKTITLNVHKQGRGICGYYSKEIAETKVLQVQLKGEEAGYPLKCIMEEE